MSFSEFPLDSRIQRALVKHKFTCPTAVQSEVIPALLSGQDVLAKARTGSGKTLAFLIPLISKLLTFVESNNNSKSILGLILVPTKELTSQIASVLKEISCYCKLKYLNLGGEESFVTQKGLLTSENWHILISTPGKLLPHVKGAYLELSDMQMLIVDEADLILSFGYKEDVQEIISRLPNLIQTVLMSATLNAEITDLVTRNVKVFDIQEKESSKLEQFVINCIKDDKFLLIYVIMKLKLIIGKCIMFVHDIERCYRLKLFLEQFGIRACILNDELPLNSRVHIVEEFNKGIFDYLITSDNSTTEDFKTEKEESNEVTKKERSKENKKKNSEFGVSRGIDFKNVAAVINFDFPQDPSLYTHRIGRTARGTNSGIALSFVCDSDESCFKLVKESQELIGMPLKPYEFDISQIEGFRYRMNDAYRAVTKTAIKEARLKELKMEILNSEKLKEHFDNNPKDLEALRHDKALHPARVQHHLKHVPDYLMVNEEKRAIRLPEQKKPAFVKKFQKKKSFGKKKKGKDPLKSIRVNCARVMLVLLIGDLHIPQRKIDIPEKLKKLLVPGKIHQIICTGNITNRETFDYLRTIATEIVVAKGDYDENISFSDRKVMNLGNFKVGIINAPLQSDVNYLLQESRLMDVNVVVYGGSCRFEAISKEGCFLVNPGSASGVDGNLPSFALLDLQANLITCYVYQLVEEEVKVDKIEFKKE